MADAMNASPDDQALRALMASYQAGRFEAFDELYGLVAPAVRRFLAGRVRDAARVIRKKKKAPNELDVPFGCPDLSKKGASTASPCSAFPMRVSLTRIAL